MVKRKFLSYVQVEQKEEKKIPYFSVVIEDPAEKVNQAMKARMLKERQTVDSLKTSSVGCPDLD